MKIKILFTTMVIGFCCLFGCSKNVPLSGKITFSDDNAPVTCGMVYFDNGQMTGRADIQPDGSYVLGFEKAGNGVPKGEYKVYFSGVAQVDKIETGQATDAKKQTFGGNVSVTSLINRKYNSAETTDIIFEADGTTQKFDIKLDRAK
ncbi:MAG: hypothetical protein Q4G68_09610 [Planctomycetia bacterium]|nr:hypothetical protein [Planctomycetia bacterium]